MDIFRDPTWQFVGVVIAVISIFISVIIYLLQRNKKSFTFDVVSVASLVSVKDDVRSRLRLIYDEKEIGSAELIIIKIYNSGNQAITPSDFIRQPKIDFGKESKILSAEVIDSVPQNIDASISVVDSHFLEIAPLLLNPSDSIRLKILLDQFKGKIDVDWRIIGIRESLFTKKADASTYSPKENRKGIELLSWNLLVIVILILWGAGAFAVISNPTFRYVGAFLTSYLLVWLLVEGKATEPIQNWFSRIGFPDGYYIALLFISCIGAWFIALVANMFL